jgi:hypothetical protein
MQMISSFAFAGVRDIGHSNKERCGDECDEKF